MRHCALCKNTEKYLTKQMCSKCYYESNKVRVLANKKDYYRCNTDEIKSRNRKYYHDNKSSVLEQKKQYYIKNIDAEIARKREYYTNLQPLWAKENLSKGANHEV
jgi:hypothetical protein